MSSLVSGAMEEATVLLREIRSALHDSHICNLAESYRYQLLAWGYSQFDDVLTCFFGV